MGLFYCLRYQCTINIAYNKCKEAYLHGWAHCMTNPDIPGTRITVVDEVGNTFKDCCRYLTVRKPHELGER